jgi:hypothetical protein
MKRTLPFYTWTRNNLPLQIEQIFKQPQKYYPIAIALRDQNPEDLLKMKYSNPSLYERLPMEIKRTMDTATYIPLEGLIPAGDLTKLVRPQEIFIELLSPYLKVPIELSLNKSFYFEKEIQKYPKETQEFLRMDIPVKLKYLVTSIIPQSRILNQINKLIKKDTRKEKLTRDEQIFEQTLSSVYKINLEDLRKNALITLSRKMDELEKGLFWANKNLRPKEIERIKQTIEEVKKNMEEIRE